MKKIKSDFWNTLIQSVLTQEGKASKFLKNFNLYDKDLGF
jgi:hypothetical protein